MGLRNRFKQCKLNNQGSTLLLVVVFTLFIGILGSIVLTVTVTNLEMRIIDNRSKDSFYQVEQVLDEVYNGIGVDVTTCLSAAYSYVSSNLVKMDASGRVTPVNNDAANELFKSKFMDYIKECYGIESTLAVGSTYTDSIWIDDCIKHLNTFVSKQAGGAKGEVKELTGVKLDGNFGRLESITFEGMRMEYSAPGDYRTSIDADITISIPRVDVNFTAAYDQNFQELWNYAIVAHDQLEVLNPGTTVTGSIFGGRSGILVANGGQLKTRSANVSTGGTIAVKNGKFIVENRNTNLFAKGIKTMEKYAPNVDRNSEINPIDVINIDADHIFVQDSLAIDGDASDVTIGKGNGEGGFFWGFGNSYAEGTGANVSSIYINGMDASVNLKGLRGLFLAGTAYIDLYSANTFVADESYMTGESVAVKTNQLAYLADTSLVPDNPTTEAEAKPYEIDYTVVYSNKPEIDIAYIYKKCLSINGQRQMFMDFQSDSSNSALLRERIRDKAGMNVRQLILPDKRCTLGAVTKVENSEVTFQDASIRNNAYNMYDLDYYEVRNEIGFNNVVADLAYRFNGMTIDMVDYRMDEKPVGHLLEPEDWVFSSSDKSPYTKYVKASWINTTIPAGQSMEGMLDNGYRAIVINAPNYDFPGGSFRGIIISNGRVNLGSNTQIEGLILAKEIVFADGLNSSISSGSEELLQSVCEKIKLPNNQLVGDYIEGYISVTQESTSGETIKDITFKNLVTIKDWKKNAE